MTKSSEILGRVRIGFQIKTTSGLHIGGADMEMATGGIDKMVVRDSLRNQPYIPGSSLRGKMRSLLERHYGLEQNQRVDKRVSYHSCRRNDRDEPGDSVYQRYRKCKICPIFGVSGENDFAEPARLIIRDAHLSRESVAALERNFHSDLPYTEIKMEASIDRITSAAMPRQIERVPAGVIFDDGEMIFSILSDGNGDASEDIERLGTVIEGLILLQEDYLGGLGSRGSGKVAFQNIHLSLRTPQTCLMEAEPINQQPYPTLPALAADFAAVKASLMERLPVRQ